MGNICSTREQSSSTLQEITQQAIKESLETPGGPTPGGPTSGTSLTAQTFAATQSREKAPIPVYTTLPTEDPTHPLADHILLIIGHKVYDVTDYPHPGGLNPLIANSNHDCTMAFRAMHKPTSTAHRMIAYLYVGDMETCPEVHRGCPLPYYGDLEEDHSASEDEQSNGTLDSADSTTEAEPATKKQFRPRCPRLASQSDLYAHLRIDQTNMFERLGYEKIKALSTQFYKHVFEDDEAKFFLELFSQSREEIIYNSYTFFVERFGGPSLDARASYVCTLNGLVNGHTEFPFSQRYQDFWLNNMRQSMQEVDIVGEDYDILNEYFQAAMKTLVGGLEKFHAMHNFDDQF